ncbi:MAG TPA: 50S ribosomal protein L11 methyltransferase [Aestuariivirga sp.]|nr:50S ribosomal protein L11 methyltransferase [Aestuariivirga sp.]
MTTARMILTIPALSLAAAEDMANRFDNDFRIEPLAVTINETDEVQNLWETVAYFATDSDAKEAQRLLQVPSGIISELPDKDWVRHSLEGLAPVVAGRFFLHGSHDRERRRHGGVSLEIDAGTAFGTGHHGTTAGCLFALDAILKRRRPQRILDLGCGTGVLAIAAALTAKRKTLATDIDPEAVRVTQLNATLNGVRPLLNGVTAPDLQHAHIALGAPYDLIFANILARPLISLAQDLASILAPGGNLILSGLTRDQVRWVLAAYRNRGLVCSQTLLLGNWATLTLSSKKKRPKHFVPDV